jgi:5'-deoxynucleotidase YfbR-like HD superfamily hydrolase
MSDDVIKYIIGQLRGACWEEEAAAVEALVDRAEELKSEVKQWHSEGMFWIEKWGAAEAKLAKAVESLQAAKVYIDDLQSHEGAEGFSVSTKQAADIYYSALAELEKTK